MDAPVVTLAKGGHGVLVPSMGKLCVCVLLLTISLPALTLRLSECPAPWFDEGIKTNAARTLALRGIYGTYTVAGYQPFDPLITAGPAELTAIALNFRLFRTGVTQARLAIIPFTLMALFSLYAIAVRLYGHQAGLFALLVMLAMPPIHGISFLLIGRQVLGEPPALAMIMLGLWLWFRSWRDHSRVLTVLSGLSLGCGLLSKPQVGFALLPTLMLIGVARGVSRRTPLFTSLTPTIVVAAIIGGWSLLVRLSVSQQIGRENQARLVDGIRASVVTGLFGRNLSPSAILILTIMCLGAASSGWRLLRRIRAAGPLTNEDWAETTVNLFVLNSAAWFALVSIGWPRYAYAGLVTSQLLIGRLCWGILQRTLARIRPHWPTSSAYGYPLAVASLGLMAMVANLFPIARCPRDAAAQKVAAYIRSEIPRDAVIESWEWQLDVPSSHWQYHHPNGRYLSLAIRQRAHEHKPVDLDYDVLQADPDYLITGPSSDWTRIYDTPARKQAFRELVHIGSYQIYKRIR